MFNSNLKELAGRLPGKLKLSAIFSLSFAAAFTAFLLTPLELYLHNPTSFVVSWKFFAPTLFVAALIVAIALSMALIFLFCLNKSSGFLLMQFAALFAVCGFAFRPSSTLFSLLFFVAALAYVCRSALGLLFKERAIDAALLIAAGLLVASQVQVLFLNGKMPLITGDRAVYDKPTLFINIAIWGIVTLLPLVIWWIPKKQKRDFKCEKPIMFIAGLICVMQIAGIVSAAIAAELPIGYDEEGPKYFSYEGAVNFSPDENIVVFILDRLDVGYMTETLEEYPHLSEQLDGFTFYKNNITEYTGTFPQVTTLLTQHYYKDSLTVGNYWKEAWARHTLLDSMRENGFTNNLYLDIRSTFGDFANLAGKSDNLKDVDIGHDVMGMTKTIGRLSLGRISPYFAKNLFLAPIDSSFAARFYRVDTVGPDYCSPLVSFERDMAFYEYIKHNDFSADSEKRVFTFIHLMCSHADWDKNVTTFGYRYDEESGTVVYGGNYIDSTRACLEMLDVYFGKMKDAGVYDNTTIFLLADHGALNYHASLLIKPKNSTGSLAVDSEYELSSKYFGASVLEAAGIEKDGLAISYFDIINSLPPPPIRYAYSQDPYWWLDLDDPLASYGFYEVRGDAHNPDNWAWIPQD